MTKQVSAENIDSENDVYFLANMVGNNFRLMMTLEAVVFGVMRRLCPDYDGGEWRFVRAPDEAPIYMYPAMDREKVFLESTNGSSASVDLRTAGLVVMTFALSHMFTLVDESDGEIIDRFVGAIDRCKAEAAKLSRTDYMSFLDLVD